MQVVQVLATFGYFVDVVAHDIYGRVDFLANVSAEIPKFETVNIVWREQVEAHGTTIEEQKRRAFDRLRMP